MRPRNGLETVILTETGTGTVWTLAGDVASELRESWGQAVTVRGSLLSPDGAAGAEPPVLEVVEYAFEMEPDGSYAGP